MRYPVPENKTIFVRFHKDLCEMIEDYAAKKEKKKATVVAEILEEYILSPFPFSPISSMYLMKRGRSSEKVRGKGMNITLKKVIDNEIRIRAEKEEMTENEFRTYILVSFLKKEKDR
jgi:hypothetical protein